MGNLWEQRALDTGRPQQDTFAADRETLEHSIQTGTDRTVQVGELNQPLQRQDQPPATAPKPPADSDVPSDPEELRRGYLRQQDYTRKTQQAAEERKAAERDRMEAQRLIAQAQQVQAQLMAQMQQAQQPVQQPEAGWFTPDELAGLNPEAQQGLRLLEQKAEARMQAALERQQRAMDERFTKAQNELRAREIMRQQIEFQTRHNVVVPETRIGAVYQTIAQNPNLDFDTAVRMATPDVYDQIVINRYEQQRQAEAKRQQQAGALQSRSGALGAAATYRPGESMRDSLMAVAAQNPEADEAALQTVGGRR